MSDSVKITEVKTEVPHAAIQPREPDADTAEVYEVYVSTDRVITDPSAPDAVQVPEAGKGSLDLPGHALQNGSVEDAFAAASKKK